MMKNSFFIWMIVLNSVTFLSLAQKSNRNEDVLKITGAALLNDERTSHYTVSVYLDGHVIDSMYVRTKKTVKFYVGYNKVYTFLFRKENLVDKIVIVNTQVPEGLKNMEDNTFDFEVEMSQSLTNKSEDLIDHPVAVLLINKKEELLEASARYHEFTHSQSKETKEEIVQRANIKAD